MSPLSSTLGPSGKHLPAGSARASLSCLPIHAAQGTVRQGSKVLWQVCPLGARLNARFKLKEIIEPRQAIQLASRLDADLDTDAFFAV